MVFTRTGWGATRSTPWAIPTTYIDKKGVKAGMNADRGNLVYDGPGPDALLDGQSLGVKGGRGERMRFTTWNIGMTMKEGKFLCFSRRDLMILMLGLVCL